MKAFVLGCDHYLQPYDLQELMEEFIPIERNLKQRFYDIVEEYIRTRELDLVAEECKPAQKTIPRSLAEEHAICYAEIDMPNDERRRVDIPEDYESRGEEVRLRGYSLREDYMCGRIAAVDHKNILVVCGAVHMLGITDRLKKSGYEVATRDLTTEDWFDPPYKRVIRGEI